MHAFRSIDSNGDGSLTKDEALRVSSAEDVQLREALLEFFDRDGGVRMDLKVFTAKVEQVRPAHLHK